MAVSLILMSLFLGSFLIKSKDEVRTAFLKVLLIISLSVLSWAISMNVAAGIKNGKLQTDISAGDYVRILDLGSSSYVDTEYKHWKTSSETREQAESYSKVSIFIFGPLGMLLWYMFFESMAKPNPAEEEKSKSSAIFSIAKSWRFILAAVFTLLMAKGGFMFYLFLG